MSFEDSRRTCPECQHHLALHGADGCEVRWFESGHADFASLPKCGCRANLAEVSRCAVCGQELRGANESKTGRCWICERLRRAAANPEPLFSE